MLKFDISKKCDDVIHGTVTGSVPGADLRKLAHDYLAATSEVLPYQERLCQKIELMH
jgi:hypothetical protein